MDSSASSFIANIADESGVTAIEYGLLAALIAIGALVGINATGVSLAAMYTIWTNAVVAAL